jgi:methenyltetrahydromethanopterin cyclohydrolase
VPGGLEAGRLLAEIGTAGLAEVAFTAASSEVWRMPGVTLRTDQPVAACLASQYAGWQIALEGFVAMGSGPMRAMAAKESLFETIGHWEADQVAVGVLDSGQLPSTEVCRYIARECGLEPDRLTLLVAPTASLAGTIQAVARSVEMAMHKLLGSGFDLNRVESAFGITPLPPVAAGDLAAMGRTYDAVLYGSEVTLWVRGDEKSLGAIGPQVVSAASAEFGQSFSAIFERHGRDFYSIDPSLFGPAVVALFNVDPGRSFRFGRTAPEVLQESFTF